MRGGGGGWPVGPTRRFFCALSPKPYPFRFEGLGFRKFDGLKSGNSTAEGNRISFWKGSFEGSIRDPPNKTDLTCNEFARDVTPCCRYGFALKRRIHSSWCNPHPAI